MWAGLQSDKRPVGLKPDPQAVTCPLPSFRGSERHPRRDRSGTGRDSTLCGARQAVQHERQVIHNVYGPDRSFPCRRFYVSMQAQHPDVQRQRTGKNGGSIAVVLIARLLYLNAAIVPP